MTSSPAASSPTMATTISKVGAAAQPLASAQNGRERTDSCAPLAKRLKLDVVDAWIGASIGASNAVDTAKPGSGAVAPPEQNHHLDSLVDVMGASGVDLQAEEEAIQRHQLVQQSQRAHAPTHTLCTQPDDDELFLQVYPLAYKVHTLAQKHGLSVDAAVLNYLSLAARTRLKNVLESMIGSSRHRSWSSHQHVPPMYAPRLEPMYREHVLNDPISQLAAVEKAERGDEARRRRQRLARDQECSTLVGGFGRERGEVDLDEIGGGSKAEGRKKPKKMGPGVAARNMSEDVRKRLADSTAMRNLGGGSSKYSWLCSTCTLPTAFSRLGGSKPNMEAAGGSEDANTPNRLPKPKFAPQPAVSNWSGAGGAGGAGANEAAMATGGAACVSTGAWGDVSARQAAREEEERQARLKVTLRDALFALELERNAATGHGSGDTLLYTMRAVHHQLLHPK